MGENKYLRKLMFELFYPAILGLGLVELLAHLARHPLTREMFFDESLSLGFLFVAFFSVSFLAAANPDANRYTAVAFGLDVVEVAMMFLCFYWLKLGPEGTGEFHRRCAYLMLLFVQPLEYAWRISVGLPWKWRKLEIFRGLIMAILLTGMLLPGYGGVTSLAVFAGVVALLIVYEIKNLSSKKGAV